MTIYVVHSLDESVCMPGIRGNSPPHWRQLHCHTCTCPTSSKVKTADPEGGRWVTCGYCHKTGIEVDDLAALTRFLRNATVSEHGGVVTVKFG